MNLPKFTHKSEETIQKAIVLANQRKNPEVEDLHLLLAMIQIDGTAKQIITFAGCFCN
jgi:ATP-dependent Clp protease ATP-binding subunit ClpA